MSLNKKQAPWNRKQKDTNRLKINSCRYLFNINLKLDSSDVDWAMDLALDQAKFSSHSSRNKEVKCEENWFYGRLTMHLCGNH